MTVARPRATAFMDEIAKSIPEARAVVQATRREQGEVLPHIEMAELTRWAIESIRTNPKPTTNDAVLRLLEMLERRFQDGDQDVDDLIGTSFLENLGQAGDDIDLMTRVLPDKLSAWYLASL